MNALLNDIRNAIGVLERSKNILSSAKAGGGSLMKKAREQE